MDRQIESLHEADDIALVEDLQSRYQRTRSELAKLIVGQDNVVEQVLLTILAGGNSLIVGVPGLAKTLLIHSIAQVLELKFSRIQFTPDLMPSDITGTDLVQENPDTGRRELNFLPGPIFANIVLADEINRTPPKTQSALLEAMQEHQVTVQGKTFTLDEPFFVFATQNPIELEGTYPLPEAQLDRFMFEIVIDYLSEAEELEVVRQTTSVREINFEYAMNGDHIRAFQKLVRQVPASQAVSQYAMAQYGLGELCDIVEFDVIAPLNQRARLGTEYEVLCCPGTRTISDPVVDKVKPGFCARSAGTHQVQRVLRHRL